MKVSIGVSNRHVHLTKEHLETLFGKNYELKKKADINQPGQFAATDVVTIKTEKLEIKNVRILGPIRSYTQVEISKTDSYTLGINPPIRDSGDLADSESITIIGPVGSVELKEGCIIPNRHIHITKQQAKYYELEGKEKVDVKIYGEKGGIINNVYLKVTDEAFFELHIDTDDANSHLIKNGDIGEIL